GIISTTLPGYYLRRANSIEYKPGFYFIATTFSVVLLIVGRKRLPRHIVLLVGRTLLPRQLFFLAASGLLYPAAYPVIAPDSSVRCLYWLVVVGNLMFLNLSLLALDAIRIWRRLKSP